MKFKLLVLFFIVFYKMYTQSRTREAAATGNNEFHMTESVTIKLKTNICKNTKSHSNFAVTTNRRCISKYSCHVELWAD